MIGLWAKNPLLGGKVSVKGFVSVLHVLLFDLELGLKGRELGFGDACPTILDAPDLIFVTLLSHGSDLVWRSAVVCTGSKRCAQEISSDVEEFTVSPVIKHEGIKGCLGLFGVESETVL